MGIIPARAGFTLAYPPPICIPADHPRSRGVYQRRDPHHPCGEGSSPLARGLHHGGLHSWCWRWIIPARAGFTRVRDARHRPPADHPRSRGVYPRAARGTASGRGSSPLARGLLGAGGGVQHDRRIIPARAGFTAADVVDLRNPKDHPRSRGVYRVRRVSFSRLCGSSPLARGLLPRPLTAIRTPGIIPARAGFTPTASHGDSHTWDHPRSRGVYPSRAPNRIRDPGSSPLARGLLEDLRQFYVEVGIIPARAGFTLDGFGSLVGVEDHPRSRGVYAPPPGWSRTGVGSSPLARGLRRHQPRRREPRRIIPARAGFTGRIGCPSGSAGDHPRSRGVYRRHGRRRPLQPGSSPLARGLPGAVRSCSGLIGIIPARAGFTRPFRSRY